MQSVSLKSLHYKQNCFLDPLLMPPLGFMYQPQPYKAPVPSCKGPVVSDINIERTLQVLRFTHAASPEQGVPSSITQNAKP